MDEKPIAEYKNVERGELLKIYRDENPESPRTRCNIGVMVCWHRMYDLGDKHGFRTPDDFREWVKKNKHPVVIPLYLYDHSGISISVNDNYPFNYRWDSMQVGYIYATRDAIIKEYGKCGKEEIVKAMGHLMGEVETYNQYLEGDIYGFELCKIEVCKTCHAVSEEIIDSCWDFYGDDPLTNGMLEHLVNEKEWKKIIKKDMGAME